MSSFGAVFRFLSGVTTAVAAARETFTGRSLPPDNVDPNDLWDAGKAATAALEAARDQAAALNAAGAGTQGRRAHLPVPKWNGQRATWRAFQVAVEATLSADGPAYLAGGSLMGFFFIALADAPDALELLLASPPVNADFADAVELNLAAGFTLGLLGAMFGETRDGRMSRYAAAFAKSYQGNRPFGEFLAELSVAAIGCGRKTDDEAFLHDLRRKTRHDLRDRVTTRIGLGTAETFAATASEIDVLSPPPSAPLTRANPMVLTKAPLAVLQGSQKFVWPSSVPADCRGSITNKDGTRDNALVGRLTAADRCFFCREVGHATTACPKLAARGAGVVIANNNGGLL